METFNLTNNEQKFINAQLKNNGCGAETAESLLVDNYSCQSMKDYREILPNLSDTQIGGYLSSLENKNVLYRDEDEWRGNTLWWVSDSYLESLEPTAKF